MDKQKRKLIISHLDQKLLPFKHAEKVLRPERGWVYALRNSLNMSMVQLANRLEYSPQSIKAIEKREIEGSITLNSLKSVAEAMDMRLVYAIVPKQESLDKLITERARELAFKIVMRTSVSMKLEDQENSKPRLAALIEEKMQEIKEEMPKYLWE
jgi:predicted DNA-binding mobile mystery protein A